jgi:hypothetical protein
MCCVFLLLLSSQLLAVVMDGTWGGVRAPGDSGCGQELYTNPSDMSSPVLWKMEMVAVVQIV